MVNKRLRCLQKLNMLNLNILKKIIIIYRDSESILVPEDNRKQDSNESYTNKYQKHVACSYGK